MIDEEKVPQTIEEAAEEYLKNTVGCISKHASECVIIDFVTGAKSEAAKEYWRAELKKETIFERVSGLGRIAIIGHCGLDGMVERVGQLAMERGCEMTFLDDSNVQKVFSMNSGVPSMKEEFERLSLSLHNILEDYSPRPYDRKQMSNNNYKKKRRK